MLDNSIRDQYALNNSDAVADDPEHSSLDPEAGGTYGDKTIWNLQMITENLNRTGDNWGLNNYGELKDGVLNFGFWKNYQELANSYYVTEDGSDSFAEVNKKTFSAFNAAQQDVARTAIGLWDDLVAISFKETKSGSADITYGNTDTGGAQAYAYLPFGSEGDKSFYKDTGIEQVGRLGGDVWIDGFVGSNFFPLQNSYYSVLTMIHETGHALGLSHPGDYNALDDSDGDGVPDPITYANDAEFAQDSLQYSVMSYFDAYETGAQHIDFTLLNFAYSSTPLVHDIATIQAMYGADMTTRAGDTVYGFHSTADRAAYDFTLNTRPIVAIWDGGGNDTIDFSGWDTPSTIDLNEGAFSSGGGTVEFLTLDEVNANRAALGFAPRTQATYDFYEDLKAQLGLTNGLFKDNVSIAYGAVIENAVGGAGNDLLIANQVANRLDGGLGLDTVSYQTATEGVAVSLLAGKTDGGAAGDVLVSIENLTGSAFRDRLTGSAGDNILEGAAGNDKLTGSGGADVFVFHTNASTGTDRITDFGTGDVIALDKQLSDPDGDGVIALKNSGVINLDRSDGDRVVLDGVNPATGVHYLGEHDGLFYYGNLAEAPVADRREAVISGDAGDNVIVGSAGNATIDVFFYDTSSAAPTGADTVTFTGRDLFVTTTALPTDRTDGIVYQADALFELPHGTVEFRNGNGLVNALEFDGSVVNNGVTYYVYSQIDSAVGVNDLHFGAIGS